MIAITAAVTSTAISTRPALLVEHLWHLYPRLLVYPSLQTEQSILRATVRHDTRAGIVKETYYPSTRFILTSSVVRHLNEVGNGRARSHKNVSGARFFRLGSYCISKKMRLQERMHKSSWYLNGRMSFALIILHLGPSDTANRKQREASSHGPS